MSAKYFLDTNIILYALEGTPPEKAVIAQALVAKAIESGDGIVSYQVVQECLNAVTSKARLALAPDDAKSLLRDTLTPLCKLFPASTGFYASALDIHFRYKFHIYDALIVAAALEARCERLYSEDLSHGQIIGSMRIENPFAARGA
jgi:predicted nucleic acid-binding protein